MLKGGRGARPNLTRLDPRVRPAPAACLSLRTTPASMSPSTDRTPISDETLDDLFTSADASGHWRLAVVWLNVGLERRRPGSGWTPSELCDPMSYRPRPR